MFGDCSKSVLAKRSTAPERRSLDRLPSRAAAPLAESGGHGRRGSHDVTRRCLLARALDHPRSRWARRYSTCPIRHEWRRAAGQSATASAAEARRGTSGRIGLLGWGGPARKPARRSSLASRGGPVEGGKPLPEARSPAATRVVTGLTVPLEAGATRFELATSCSTGRRSNQAELRPPNWQGGKVAKGPGRVNTQRTARSDGASGQPPRAFPLQCQTRLRRVPG